MVDFFLFLGHLVSERTFGVMYYHALFFACKSLKQTSGHKKSGLSTWLQMATSIFLRVLYEYAWVNILTSFTPEGMNTVTVVDSGHIMFSTCTVHVL